MLTKYLFRFTFAFYFSELISHGLSCESFVIKNNNNTATVCEFRFLSILTPFCPMKYQVSIFFVFPIHISKFMSEHCVTPRNNV